MHVFDHDRRLIAVKGRSARGPWRGQSLVEFSLMLPVLLLLLFGIVDGGRAIYALSTINNAAREAARVAIVDQTLGHIQAEAQAQSVGLGISSGQVTVIYRTFDDTAICGSPPAVGCLAVVTVTYTYTAVTPIIGQLMGNITMNGRSFFPIEATCIEPPAAKCPKGD
jgi:Flp pilus assembly protein TadG